MEQFLKYAEEKQPTQTKEEKPPEKAKSRHIPIETQREVIQRTHGLCAYPGCTKRYEILHHTRRFALEEVHDPKRLQPLCEGHEKLAHLGLIANEQEDASTWSLRAQPNRNSPEYWIDQQVALYR